jgi:hypothetical protein
MNGNGTQYIKSNGQRFFGASRSEKRANRNLGIVHGGYGDKESNHRSEVLKKIDMYLAGTQYDGLHDWDEDCYDEDSYVKLKNRKPKIIFPFAKMFMDRVGSKLVGNSTFPKFYIEEDDETDYFINKVLIPSSYFKAKMLGVGKDLVLRTSAFARFKFAEGNLQIIKYNTNYCYPTFDQSGELESVQIKYVYDTDRTSSDGKTIKEWFKLDLTKTSDILYDNPEYKENQEPEFTIAERIDHNFGFVQGEWFRTGDNPHSPEGAENPVIHDMTDFIDCINYNLSLSDKAANYGTEPQLALSGLDSEETEKLIKSASKTWALGREGKAQFLEISGNGVEVASKQRDDYLKFFQYISRLVMLDPEKMAASAQSGKAMEVLHAPLVEMINEIRPWMEKGMKGLIQKIVTTIVLLNSQGYETQFIVPQGWTPQSLDIQTSWPPIFELTTQDKQQILSMGIQASNANIISRDTALAWIQSQGVDFGVEDFELEQQKINTQQRFNTFGF